MKHRYSTKTPSFSASEKKSAKLLMEKMDISKKEMQEIVGKYGVSASKLVELMELSKYEFVNDAKQGARCTPCEGIVRKSVTPKFI
jgi:hypothetical protein